ncbi:protein Barley B recombinant-like [Canna indica]|uniref:GAGA-binding transcriptional activator n=1 Tax=Canna indica TaxID=4628 RepID=A0AAQ3QIG6_9LILI|nr:protein Barley B recombinant-like [Canna indica]
MDDDGGLGNRNWGYYEQPLKGNLGLQLMSSVAERDTKNLLSNGGFFHRDCSVPEPSVPTDIVRDSWIHHCRDNDNKILHMLPVNHYHHHHHPHYSSLPDPPTAQAIRMLQDPEPPKDDKFQMLDETVGKNETPLKKRAQGRPQKSPKPKKQKKVAKPRDETTDTSVSRRKSSRESEGMVINGVSLDISGIPTPVCSCTGKQQQCYRWGAGGWQSACCTTNMSMYPLPMSTKRRGARIAGRKMSQGAFRKVLEKLTEEGHNLSNPIDLKVFWAKHGTNKFVTIRLLSITSEKGACC